MGYALYKDNKREWRWRYTAPNGNVIATSSEGYRRKIDAKAGIDLMKQSANAEIEVLPPVPK